MAYYFWINKKAIITITIQLFSEPHKQYFPFFSCNLKPAFCNAIKQKETFPVM